MRSMRTVLCSQMDLTAPALTPTPSHCANGPLPTRRLEYCPQHSSILKRFRDAGRRHLSCRIVNSAVACRGGTTALVGTRPARDLAPSDCGPQAASAAFPGNRGSRHFNRTIVGLDTGACCDFSEPKSAVSKIVSIDAMKFGA